MNPKVFGAPLCALLAAVSITASAQGDAPAVPSNATFTTLAITRFQIEGLTGDDAGNFYTTGRATPAGADNPCPVWRIDSKGGIKQVGAIPNAAAPNACNPSGITFDAYGNLYVADAANGGQVWKLTRKADGTFNTGEAFATGVPGANGVAFDREGNLWTGDGTTNAGRVWRISAAGGTCEAPEVQAQFVRCQEVFRIQPMATTPTLERPTAVGRQAMTLPTDNAQGLVANGVAFDESGDLYVADTARGAIWRVQFNSDGSLRSRTGCDPVFPADTLCMENVFVAHPLLEGSDGIALDSAGNIWSDANERNAVVVVTRNGNVTEVFRNPVNKDTGLRNSADDSVGNNRILETPTSPFLSGKRFCTANSDGNRRDNSPSAAGEINSGGAVGTRGKISCMDQALIVPGMTLPVR